MTDTDETIRILIVDDQDLVRAGFRIILESEPGLEVVGEASTGREAITAAAALRPDVICMDVQMPDMDGLEATRAIVADPSIPSAVLILTTFDRDDYLFDALRSGASGFLLKNATPENLVEAVQIIARGDALLSPDVTRRVIERFGVSAELSASTSSTSPAAPARPDDRAAGSITGDAPPAASSAPDALSSLTEREHEVLAHLARGRSNAEIAAELYLGEATIKTHVSKILMKLGLRDRIQAVVFAYEHGIAVPGSPS